MLRQYYETKAKLAPGTLLLFRVGDFFELFAEDARIASNLLGLTLTQRGDCPMAGVPHHALEVYVQRLLKAGRKVAVCDQLEEPRPGKLVRRALTRVYTPGTTISAEHLEANHNHYLLALDQIGSQLVASWMELSTGEWVVAATDRKQDLLTFLTLLGPAEMVVRENGIGAGLKEELIENLPELTTTDLPESFFEPIGGRRILCEALGVASLKAFGLADDHAGLGAAAALYTYASQALCGKPENLKGLTVYEMTDRLLIDPTTARQLEIFKDLSGSKEGALITALDSTMTASGGRLLERVMLEPSCDIAELNRRLDAVGAFVAEAGALEALRERLKNLRDLERIVGRLQNRLRTPRELVAIRETLRGLPQIKIALEVFSPAATSWMTSPIGTHDALFKLLVDALDENPEGDIAQGGYVRPGYDATLDNYKNLSANHKIWLAEFERVEQERTGIKSLKVRYNNNFGFFIEVTKANLARVPADYIRKSTTVNGERYVTEALVERQKEILSAETNAVRRELEIFETLVSAVLAQADALRATAGALSWVDLMSAFAHNALAHGYCRPELNSSTRLVITAGRHPVVEAAILKTGVPGEKFVPNDADLSSDKNQIILLTGPNMAGKSTYIRQVALIVYMAQIGSWVPAARAEVGLTDRIFSRIGSADALHRGESTFMVEMTETAYILRHATAHSLVVLDEIGRGTSTYDGLSIAWAVAEYLHANPAEGPRTLFATHYHELTRLEKTLPRLKNYTVLVKEWGQKLIFVRQVVAGVADRSYGVHVARLAGMPAQVVERAAKILEGLEASAKAPKAKAENADDSQQTLF
jgi:DNA mismatch repair protein MutS